MESRLTALIVALALVVAGAVACGEGAHPSGGGFTTSQPVQSGGSGGQNGSGSGSQTAGQSGSQGGSGGSGGSLSGSPTGTPSASPSGTPSPSPSPSADAGMDSSFGPGSGAADAAAADGAAPCSNPDDLEGCPCTSGQTQQCYPGDPSQAGVGVCTWGTQSCMGGGELAQWGACTGFGSPTPAACDGVDHLCNGMPNAGCACTTGATQACYTGPAGTEGVGTCVGGTQTCVANPGGGSNWGPCDGEVLPTAEVCTDMLDHSCSGLAGCANPMCTMTAGCVAQETAFCNEGGKVFVNDVSYTGEASFGSVELCSGDAAGDGEACGPTLGQGGTFNTNCAGTYKVCARVVSQSGCTIASGCVMVTVPTNNATVTLPPFPGFGPLENSCLDGTYPSGNMSTSLDVTGTTTTGIMVNRPNVATGIDIEYWGGGGGGSGSGGGGF